MTYLDLINRFWKMNKECLFTPYESHLYLKLLDTCNSLGWKLCFTQSNRYLCAETGMSERKLIETRENLVQFGLISYESGKQKRDLTQYIICGVKNVPQKTSSPQAPADSNSVNESQQSPENDEHKTGVPTGEDENPGNSSNENNREKNGVSDTENNSEKNSENNSEKNSENDSEKNSESGKKSTDNIRPERKDKDKNRKKRGDKSPLSAEADAKVPVQHIMDEYNRLCVKLPKATTKSEARARAVRIRTREHGLETVMKMLKLASESDYLGGNNKDNWMATFDWLFNPRNFVKVLEGNYANRASSKTAAGYVSNKPSPLQLLEEAYENLINDGTIPG